MKTFIPVLALAAGATATFNKATPFTCPGNTDNKCTEKQKPGFDWNDLDFGDFFQYNDFSFSGWKCEDEAGSRGRFAPRTGKKAIGATCHSDKKKSPSFGCGASVDRFSLGSILVRPEFDCDLEFHYDMPDGSKCKHRSACKKSGTTVVNRQCGGAKNVTIVYPPQPNKPKPSCTIKVPTISFDCSTASSTKTPKTTKTTKTKATTSASATSVVATTTSVVQGSPSSSSAAPGDSTTSLAPEVSSTAVLTPGTSTAVTVPGNSSTSVAPGGDSTSEAPVTSSAITKTITTSFDSTSTVFTTSTQTITQCEPTVTDCPANSVVTTVVTIAVSTTICPVTETMTTIESITVPGPADSTSEGPADSSETPAGSASEGPAGPTSEGPAGPASTTVAGDSSSTGGVTSALPLETLPCPSVVPSCLNTFMFNVGCADNTDAACYCPDATFVKNVFDCLYAHGESDDIIAEAVAYFQGICGKWVNENPGIATDATVTTYITVTAAPTVVPAYTTIVVEATTVVPCTDDAGQEIPSSSTTVTINTSMTVPQVDFTTGPAGGVGVVPITDAPTPTGGPGSDTPTATGGAGSGGDVAVTTSSTVTLPIGTGSLRPTTSGVFVVPGAANRAGASFGLAAAVAAVAALVL
ncbi:hypothetical protein BT67DRAFT_374718 [Trichocladium antarcticum]|uniref:CFEM domain-containing protein n=1 Tax=Trichocladium antarcticum TaxID=1450529 RepID=A0AAN6UQH4_9PEZI|nr:hypothetical protein BT67DRAFT_374718 [Trichocladium antarcticum]